MNVLLISANPLTTPYPVYPVGLDYVAGAIPPRHRVHIADINLTRPDALTALIDSFHPDVVGLSLRNVDNTDIENPRAFLDDHRGLCHRVRQATRAPIILGGSGFTIFPTEMLAALDADYGIAGEGERLAPLLDALENGTDPARLPGVIVRGGTGHIPPPLARMIQRPVVADGAHRRFYLDRGGMLNLQTKRGCPFKCVYCTYPHIEGRHMRRIPPADVAATAVRLVNAGARYLFITDSAFNADFTHSAAVAEAFVHAGIKVPWGGFFTPIAPPAGYFRRLARAGLAHVEFGTESLADEVLKAYGKPFTAGEVLATHRRAVAAGLYVAHYMLLGGPGETPETIQQTLRTIDKLEKTVIFIFCGMRIYPHTALYDLACRQGQVVPGRSLLAPVFYRSPAMAPERILARIHAAAAGRGNWILNDGGDGSATVLDAMYRRGFSGPLWEYLIK